MVEDIQKVVVVVDIQKVVVVVDIQEVVVVEDIHKNRWLRLSKRWNECDEGEKEKEEKKERGCFKERYTKRQKIVKYPRWGGKGKRRRSWGRSETLYSQPQSGRPKSRARHR